MADLPTDSIERVADARRQAESELRKNLSGVRESDDVAAYLPPFRSFACALFDSEAGELLAVCEDAGRFERALESEITSRIIEGILPDRSLRRITAGRFDEVKRLSVGHDLETDLLWEVGPDGTRKPARKEIQGVYAQHGEWENFMPQGLRFLVRFPNNNATVRAALNQALQRRAVYWAGQFHIRAKQGVGAAKKVVGGKAMRARARSEFLDRSLAEREWSDSDLAREAGLSFKTIKRYRNGDVTNRRLYVRTRIAKGLQVNLFDVAE